MISRPKEGSEKIKFSPNEDRVAISLSCECGAPVNKLLGFGVMRGDSHVSFAACECTSGHRMIIELADVAAMVEMPKDCIQ